MPLKILLLPTLAAGLGEVQGGGEAEPASTGRVQEGARRTAPFYANKREQPGVGAAGSVGNSTLIIILPIFQLLSITTVSEDPK